MLYVLEEKKVLCCGLVAHINCSSAYRMAEKDGEREGRGVGRGRGMRSRRTRGGRTRLERSWKKRDKENKK